MEQSVGDSGGDDRVAEQQDVGVVGNKRHRGELADLALVALGLEGEVGMGKCPLKRQMCQACPSQQVALTAGSSLGLEEFGVGSFALSGGFEAAVWDGGGLGEAQLRQILAGAALAAIAYGQSGLIPAESACCFAFASVGSWLPVLLLGSALAIRAHGWSGRIRGWSLAALALSQIVASWPGQGSYYGLLVFGSFVTFKVLTQPSEGEGLRRSGWWHWLWTKANWLALHLAIPTLLGSSAPSSV